MLLFVGVSKDFEDVVYEGFTFIRWQVAGVDGLFIGLEVAGRGFFGQVLVYKSDYGVDLLSREAVSAAG